LNLTQEKRNICKQLVRVANRRIDKVRTSTAETFEHKSKKEEICKRLSEQGKSFITEAIFKTSGRADILVLDDFKVIEVVHSESEARKEKKRNTYPGGLEINFISTGDTNESEV